MPAMEMTMTDPPPVLPDVMEQLESHLLEPDHLPIHSGSWADGRIRFWQRIPEPQRLLHMELSPMETTLKVDRDLATGKTLGYREYPLPDAGATARNSTSLRRAPGPPDQSTRGDPSNYPFWPGGLDKPEEDKERGKGTDSELESILLSPSDLADDSELFDPDNYLTIPSGFERGFHFVKDKKMPDGEDKMKVLDLASLLVGETDDDFGIWSTTDSASKKPDDSINITVLEDRKEDTTDSEFDIEDSGVPLVKIGDNAANLGASHKLTVTEWVEEVDVMKPVKDFHTRVPQMAHAWPFELDTFQKQAVLRLESNDSVFVSAHTSAGKTVVAEYAIALSQKHLTRTIYTSPIKALSNQKFREFKETFSDVGLVTGDIQINPTATCLIMTTEILRSMLYNGSDIIRDLEYVIFDEVHYINDAERGVVWEEVLILLPDHVNVILLSATVPNPIEFAEWVGMTKRKKIYVISTVQRPVPLEHYLYTGSNAKTKEDLFLLQDASGRFLTSGHNKALESKKPKGKQQQQTQYGAKGVADRVGPQQEKNIWLTLIDFLSCKDKLPVVAFTLSRNRCDQNANLLTSLDLTTSVEKSDIHHFIHRCVQRLKGSDRKLPQVLQMTELLKRGIGIHHSGVLPILKEVVELLFQRGFVKLLFATETFAMGVNMPARTVVFDNIRKHDGTSFRTLKPAEYIQMAGRAGRRGLDSTGTVIILCKSEVHQINELSLMMQGKPEELKSKFRLTYSMILNLLRVEQLRVEDMMKRSFAESTNQKLKQTRLDTLQELRNQLTKMPADDKMGNDKEKLYDFYDKVKKYLESKDKFWTLLLSHPAAVKALTPGRVLLINSLCYQYVNRPAVLISVNVHTVVKTYNVLVLKTSDENKMESGQIDENFIRFFSMLRAVPSCDFAPDSSHKILSISDKQIIEIMTKFIKIDADKIVADIKKREIPRFRSDPPGQSTANALQELVRVHGIAERGELEGINILKEFKIQDLDQVQAVSTMQMLRSDLKKFAMRNDLPHDFEELFCRVYDRKQLEAQVAAAEYLASNRSLQHLSDYEARIKVLRKMQYIDDTCTVCLKGRVACEMSSHELMITELVLDNALTDLPPAEIAALLSCMVFQQRKCSEPTLNKKLLEGKKKVEMCAQAIDAVQREYRVNRDEATDFDNDQFNFGLAEVVHEWGLGRPFAEITALTDVQEGVIVRTIQRLDEVLRDVKDAARVIGDTILYQKMDQASACIKRDIVFAASLYTQ